MIRLAMSCAFLLAAASFSCQQTRQSIPAEKLATTRPSLEPPQPEVIVRPLRTAFPVGEFVRITVIVRNSSDRDLEYCESRIDADIHLIVENADGHRMPLTQFGRNAEEMMWTRTRNVRLRLSPGEQREYEVLVNFFIHMPDSGRYFIRARLLTFAGNARDIIDVISKPAQVEVVRARPAGFGT